MGSSFIPCEIDDLCASLEHTWLKNRLLAQIEANREAWVVADGQLPSVLAALPRQIQQTRLLVADIYDGFSPAQLVERVPLSPLPSDVKTLIKGAVHQSYLELGTMQPLVKELGDALDHFEAVAKRISSSWQGGCRARRQVIDELKLAAIHLRSALLALPREVVLP